jgi:hypothetical protein
MVGEVGVCVGGGAAGFKHVQGDIETQKGGVGML